MNEATGEVFTKYKKLPEEGMDFTKMSVDDLTTWLNKTRDLAFNSSGEQADMYLELWKIARNQLPQMIEQLPKNKQEFSKIYTILDILGVDKGVFKGKNFDHLDINELSKTLPKKMGSEKMYIDRNLLNKNSDMSKALEDIELTSSVGRYIGEKGGEFTKSAWYQKGFGLASEVAGASYRKVKPVIEATKKVTKSLNKLSDESLLQLKNKLLSHNNKGAQVLGNQLQRAIEAEGPLKNALLWSLSQQPALRNVIESVEPDMKSDLSNLIPENEDLVNNIPEEEEEEIINDNGVGKLSDTDVDGMLSALSKRESSNNPKAINRLGYAGKYQFGAQALEDLGYIKKGSHSQYKNSALKKPELYTGKQGITNLDSFLNNESAQDSIGKEYFKRIYKMLESKGFNVADMDRTELAGLIMESHLIGPTGVKNSRDSGVDSQDAMGTKGSEYNELGVNTIAKIDEIKNNLNRVMKMKSSGKDTPEHEIESTFKGINELEIPDQDKLDLQNKVVQMESFSNLEDIIKLLDKYKN